MAHRAGRTPAPVHARRRMAAPGDLGHGHRQLRRHRRRPARGLPDEPGRQQAPDAGERDRPADLPGHRDRRGRDRDASVHGRRSAALDGMASRVPGRQQRRARRPVRLQGQRRGAAGLRVEGPEQPADRTGGRDVRRGGPRRGHRELRQGTRRGRRRPQPRRHARHRAGEPPREREPVPQRGFGHRRRTRADGQLDRGAPRADRPEPRRDRLVDPGAVRRPHRRAGAHDRRGPRERRARVGPRRARRRRLGRGPDPVARRRGRPLAGGRREPRSSRSRADGEPTAWTPAGAASTR